MADTRFTRRRFLQVATAGIGAAPAVPGALLGADGEPGGGDRIRLAAVGVGRMGYNDFRELARASGVEVTCVCDVDWRYKNAPQVLKDHPKAKQYTDYRRMFAEASDQFDAVMVATPDHTHAPIVMEALRAKKAVYCEKPLARDVREIRAIEQAAREAGVTTQLGNQGRSYNEIRQVCEWIWDGAIGEVSEVHLWCHFNRGGDYYTTVNKLGRVGRVESVPESLDYNLWLGPSPTLPYSSMWVHRDWRGWRPFGSGRLGDWWCHIADPAYWALHLDHPESVKAEVIGYDPDRHALTFPPAQRITFQFPANDKRGPVKLVWHDGHPEAFTDELRPPRPPQLGPDDSMPDNGGVLYGSDGAIIHGSHGAGGRRIIPRQKMQAYGPKMPDPHIPRVKGGHQDNWLRAIRRGEKAVSDFVDVGGPMTEGAVLGNIATLFPGQVLRYDPAKRRFTNNDQANAYLAPAYRAGWAL